MLPLLRSLILVPLLLSPAAHAQISTLFAPTDSMQNPPSIVVGTNQVIELLYFNLASSIGDLLIIRTPDKQRSGANICCDLMQRPIVIAGPASVTLTSRAQSPGHAFITYKISEKDAQLTPSSAVVIPADSTGPVEIVLESSSDLITWSRALPGIYGSSTEKRFFFGFVRSPNDPARGLEYASAHRNVLRAFKPTKSQADWIRYSLHAAARGTRGLPISAPPCHGRVLGTGAMRKTRLRFWDHLSQTVRAGVDSALSVLGIGATV
jgi:hypothetical protein